ncbi:hypothetical protein INR49_023720 [Caranx melampygus]|nr:hypothetical protein INR49_023720 [Caranx melampygus]
MVRLRSVNMTEDQVKASTDDKPTDEGVPLKENCPVSIPGPQSTPQKPIRKSLSLKSPPQTVKASSVTLNTPSMRLQEAIRMKTAAMSSRDGLPSRLGVRSSTYSLVSEPGALSLKSPEGCDVHKSPASTASFIFSRSTKKVVIETASASSPEAQASLKQSLAAELMHVSDQSRAVTFANGGVKCDKVPPPVAKKPAHGSISPLQHYVAGNGAIGDVQHASGITPPETTTTRHQHHPVLQLLLGNIGHQPADHRPRLRLAHIDLLQRKDDVFDKREDTVVLDVAGLTESLLQLLLHILFGVQQSGVEQPTQQRMLHLFNHLSSGLLGIMFSHHGGEARHPNALQHGLDDLFVVLHPELQKLPGGFHVVQVGVQDLLQHTHQEIHETNSYRQSSVAMSVCECVSHLEVPGDELELLIRTQLICHVSGPADCEEL